VYMGGTESMIKNRLLLLAALLGLAAVAAISSPPAAQAAVSRDSFEGCLLDRANADRSAAGVAKLEMAHDMVPAVRDWSKWMRFNEFQHMDASLRSSILPDSWTTWAENIARHSNENLADCEAIHSLWMNSSKHRDNILNPNMRFVAIGTYVDETGWWATQLFFNATGYSATCNGTFCDDDGSVFEEAIEKIAAAGITQGCNPPTNNRYCPDDLVTRGAMAAFLSRAFPLLEGSDVNFSDIGGSMFQSDIKTIAAAGITRGCNPPSNTLFCPNDYITRGEMAAFLSRALPLPEGSDVSFSDIGGSVFRSDIQSLAAAGVTRGCNPPSNTLFCPNEFVTRGQMAAFLARALDLTTPS
jgi:hypothetical protein